MTFTSFTSGTKAQSSQVNNNFSASSKILQIYTGSSLDISAHGALDTTNSETSSVELDEIYPSSFGSADYILVELNGLWTVRSEYGALGHDGHSNITCLIETMDIGGTYTTSFPNAVIYDNNIGSVDTELNLYIRAPFKWLHTLTANEKSNGIQIKITLTGEARQNGSYASFDNDQVILYSLSF